MQGDGREVWRARIVLFFAFALMAGGLAGSVVVLVLKYILNEYADRYLYYGYASVVQVSLPCRQGCHGFVRCAWLRNVADINILQNVALMLSAIVLWLATQSSNEYEYSLTL